MEIKQGLNEGKKLCLKWDCIRGKILETGKAWKVLPLLVGTKWNTWEKGKALDMLEYKKYVADT